MAAYYMFNGKAVKITDEEQKSIRDNLLIKLGKYLEAIKKKYPNYPLEVQLKFLDKFELTEFHEHQSLIAEQIYNSRPAPQK
jgi:hypothetical protein